MYISEKEIRNYSWQEGREGDVQRREEGRNAGREEGR